MQRPFLLGVAGGTGSGRTTVARRILDAVGETRLALPRDGRRLPRRPMARRGGPAAPRLRPPQALDFELLIRHLAELRSGRAVEAPIYDFKRHRRTERTRTIRPDAVIIVGSVRPMHLEFVEPSKRWADVIIPEGVETTVAVEMVAAQVEKILDRGVRAATATG